MSKKAKIYSVTELTKKIKYLLENNYPAVWIEGEVSNCSRSQLGHTYFTVKDEKSQISAVLFRGKRQALKSNVDLKDGIHITVYGKLTVYERAGNYQIIVDRWEPKGIGALQLAFEELKKKLFKEGLFDDKLKKTIPVLPHVVGVVTSPTGAAIRDILNVINRRFSNLNILIYPVRVQGQQAASEIAEGIDYMNTLPEIDVLIIGRGGGSIEDLWAFNEEIVARSIFKSRIPIISAVGHEIDYTISDLVADKRAPTPSAAAELVISKKTEFISKIEFLTHKIESYINDILADYRERIKHIKTHYVFREPQNNLRQYIQKTDDLIRDLQIYILHQFQFAGQRVVALCKRLDSVNPAIILRRGYSITINADTGQILKSSEIIKKSQKIKTILDKGSLLSAVLDKSNKGLEHFDQ